jgi:hypothetical protein
MKFSSELSVTNFIKTSLELCAKSNLADLMSISAKVSKDNKRVSYVKPHLPAIALRANALSDSQWKFRDVSAVIYGLKFVSDTDPGATDIVRIMTQAVNQIVNSGGKDITTNDISRLLNGLVMFNPNNEELVSMIGAMVPVVRNAKEIFTHQRISTSIYALLNMTTEYKENREMISVLCEKLSGSIGDLVPTDYINMGFGLRGMNSDYSEIRTIYSVIAKSLKNCQAEFKLLNLFTMIHNLSSANSDHAEVREYLSAVHTQLKVCTSTEANSKFLSNAIFGMRKMNSDRREVRNILSLIAGKIKRKDEDWSILSIGNALLGLQRMSDCPELVILLNTILPKIRNLKTEMTAQSIADCVFGTQNLTGDTVPKRDLLYALNIELKKSSDLFTPKAGSDFLYGLQRMTIDCDEVKSILATIALKFQLIPKDSRFTAIELCNALYGLQGLWNGNKIENEKGNEKDNEKNNSDFSTILDEICVRADVSSYFEDSGSDSATKVTTEDLVNLQKTLYFFLFSVNSENSEENQKIFESVNLLSKSVTTELEKRKEQNDGFYSTEKSVSENEKKIFEILTEIYENEKAEISQNTLLLNSFELGLLITLPRIDSEDSSESNERKSGNIKINVEINTLGVENSKKTLYRERRDALLGGENILVVRLHDAILEDMSREGIKELILKKLEIIKK